MKNIAKLVINGQERLVRLDGVPAEQPTPALVNTAAPVITGPTYVGQEVTVTAGSWSAIPDGYSYQWYLNGSPISGATTIKYLLRSGDLGGTVYVRVTAVKQGYSSALVQTAAITVAASVPLVDSDELAPSADVPTVTYASLASSASPSIAGSPGWLREKRQGVAETAAGGSQTSTAALDLTGSTRFRYSGIPSAAGFAANPGQYVSSDYKPGGSSQSAYWLFSLEFVIENTDRVELRLNAPTTNPRLGMVVVNGRRIQATSLTATATSGAGYSATLTFPSVARRHIKIYGLNHNMGRFGGVAVPAGGIVSKPTNAITKRIAVIGDSFTNGANGVASTETFAWDLVRKMGGDEIIQAGIGGTGFVATINSESASAYQGRVNDVLAMNPHVILFVGGRNDGNVAGLASAVQTILSSTDGVPSRWVISQSVSSSGNDTIRSATQAENVPFVDMSDHASTVEISSDGVHPTYNGHRTFAAIAYDRIMNPPETPSSEELTPATGVPSTGLFYELPTSAQIASGPNPDRMALAHYYAPQPGAFSNAASDYYENNYLTVNGENGKHAANGGYLRDRPMLNAPFPTGPVSWQRNMQAREIVAAKQVGLDGFFCNVMGSSGDNWNRYMWMLQEAEANFPGFKVVPMIDANGSMAQNESAEICAARINTFLVSSASWRLSDGRYVVGTFKVEGKPVTYWAEVKSILLDTYEKDIVLIGVYNNINQAVNYRSVQWAAGQWGNGTDPSVVRNGTKVGTAIKGRGEKFLYPMWPQNVRYTSGLFDESCNTEAIREASNQLIEQAADITQLCTWSDHSEGSQMRPTVARGMVSLDIVSYRITKWKTGKFPVILRDAVYLSHRNQMLDATITGGQTNMLTQWSRSNRSLLRQKVEVLTYLTAPANITLKVGSSTYAYTAPAGEYAYLAEMQPGEVSVKAVRSGSEIARINSPVVIRSTVVNQDRQYFMFSSLRGTAGQYDPTPGAPSPNASNYIV